MLKVITLFSTACILVGTVDIGWEPEKLGDSGSLGYGRHMPDGMGFRFCCTPCRACGSSDCV